ncbi:uncharacterized protein RBU57_016810 isoform 2-T9 [Macrochelys suwanniensis]
MPRKSRPTESRTATTVSEISAWFGDCSRWGSVSSKSFPPCSGCRRRISLSWEQLIFQNREEHVRLISGLEPGRGPSRPVQQPQTEEEHLEEVDLRNLGVSLGRGAEQLLRCWRSRFPNEIGQRRDWPTCGRDQRRSSHPEPIPRDGSQTVTCRRDRPGAQPEERLEDVNLSSLDVLLSRDEQPSAFCLRHNWLTKGTEVEGQSRLPSCDGKRARAGRPRALLMPGKSRPAGSGSAVAISEISVSLEACSRPVQQPQTEEEHLEEVDLHNLDVSLGSGAEEPSRDRGGGCGCGCVISLYPVSV